MMQSPFPMLSKFTRPVVLGALIVLDALVVTAICFTWGRMDDGFWTKTTVTILFVFSGLIPTCLWIVLSIENAFREQMKANVKTSNLKANSDLDLRVRVINLERAAGIQPKNNSYEIEQDDRALSGERSRHTTIRPYTDEWLIPQDRSPEQERTPEPPVPELTDLAPPSNAKAPVETEA